MTTIDPSDANIVYSPYNWLVASGLAKSVNPGAYFRMLVTGAPATCDLLFDVSGLNAPLPQVTVRIDGITLDSYEVAASIAIMMPTITSASKHLVEVIFKSATETQDRWNAQTTAVKFIGLSSATVIATEAIERLPRNLLIYGDSITEGVRTLSANGAVDDTDRNCSYIGWAYLQRERLGMEVGVVGFGGSGLTGVGSGNVPPLPTSYDQLWSGQTRDFTPAPDVVLLNEGTNDVADVTAAYTTVIDGVLGTTPMTTELVCLRPFKDASHASQIQAAIAACSTPARVHYVDTNGWFDNTNSSDGLHPYGYIDQARLSFLVAGAIRSGISTVSGALSYFDGGSSTWKPAYLQLL